MAGRTPAAIPHRNLKVKAFMCDHVVRWYLSRDVSDNALFPGSILTSPRLPLPIYPPSSSELFQILDSFFLQLPIFYWQILFAYPFSEIFLQNLNSGVLQIKPVLLIKCTVILSIVHSVKLKLKNICLASRARYTYEFICKNVKFIELPASLVISVTNGNLCLF